MKIFPSVSVIIPTKNEAGNILRCVKSIKKQKYKGRIEIVLVDNFSTDRTVDIATPYVNNIIEAGPERSSQRNLGAKKAKGNYLLFLDADMECSPAVISECVFLATNSIYPPIVAIAEEARGNDFWGKALALEKNCYRVAPTWLWAARFFPKKLFLKYGLYDTKLVSGEDWDVSQRLIKKGIPLLSTQKSYVFHYENTSNIYKLLEKEYYYIKNIYRYAKKQPIAFSYQGSILYRGFVWARNWRKLVRYPLLTTAFLSYKFFVWLMWQWYKVTHKF